MTLDAETFAVMRAPLARFVDVRFVSAEPDVEATGFVPAPPGRAIRMERT